MTGAASGGPGVAVTGVATAGSVTAGATAGVSVSAGTGSRAGAGAAFWGISLMEPISKLSSKSSKLILPFLFLPGLFIAYA
jgi:hypothetical protein